MDYPNAYVSIRAVSISPFGWFSKHDGMVSFSVMVRPSYQSAARLGSLIASLRVRYVEADHKGDAQAKQALFQEAIYLGIQPELFTQPQ